MVFDRTKTLKQPSILTYNGEILGFTSTGFTLDPNPTIDYEFGEEFPTIPIMSNVVGLSPVVTVDLLQTDENTLSAAFGGFVDGDSMSFPGSIIPGTDIYEDPAWVGELAIEPRVGQRGIYIKGEAVQPIITNVVRLSVLDRVTLTVSFLFLFDKSDNVIEIEFRNI